MTYPKNDEVSDEVHGVAVDRLRSFLTRIERLEDEIKVINEDKSDVYGEAKGEGFDVKAIKQLVRERRRDRDQVKEERNILDLYRTALGME